MQYKPGSPIICHPLFTNDARSKVGAIVRNPENRMDVRWHEEARETKSQFIYDCFSQYSEEQIEANTRREQRIVAANRKARSDAAKRDVRTRHSEELFAAKDEAVEAIKDKRLKRLARKSRSVQEVAAVRAADILRSLDAPEEPTIQEQENESTET